MANKDGGGTSGKGGTGESTNGNSGDDGSVIWRRWSGSQYERRDGSNSKSSSIGCDIVYDIVCDKGKVKADLPSNKVA